MTRILRSAIVLLLLCSAGVAFAQSSSGIKGVLVDEKGQPIVNANVVVTEGGIQKGHDQTDFDGNYSIKPLNGGNYEVRFTYLGRDLTISGVILATDQTRTVNGKLQTTNEAIKGGGGVTVHAVSVYRPPIVDAETPGGRQVKTAEQIDKAPTHNTADIAALSTQVHSDANGLSIGGGRTSGTKYVVDGVQLSPGSSTFINQAPGSIETITTFSSGIPARYGDASGGLVTITTKGATSITQGNVQYEHSLEGYNQNQLTFNLSGPLLTRKDSATGARRPLIGYSLTADGVYDDDQAPIYYQSAYINADKMAQLQEHPLQRYQLGGLTRSDYSADLLRDSNISYQKQRPNAQYYRGQVGGKLDFNVNDNINVRIGASYFNNDRPEYDRALSLFSIDNTARTYDQTGRGYIRFTQKFGNNSKGGEPGSDTKGSAINNAFYTVQVDYSKDYSTTQDPNHKHNTFDYGYVGKFDELYTPTYDPGGIDQNTGRVGVLLTGYTPSGVIFTPGTQNPILANYTKDFYALNPPPVDQNSIVAGKGLRNGDVPADVYGLFRNIGTSSNGRNGWRQTNNDQIAVQIDASFDIKQKKTTHSIEFGLYYQQRNERFYSVSGATIWSLMRQLTKRVVDQEVVKNDKSSVIYVVGGKQYTYDDVIQGRVNPGSSDTVLYRRKFDTSAESAFDRHLREKLIAMGEIKSKYDYVNPDKYDPSFYSLDMFSADDLLNSGNSAVGYYGYDYAGKPVTGTVNFNDFWTAKDKDGYYTRPIGAYRPNYIAGYLSDYIQYKDFRITLGLRIERFDNNTKVLKDPYSLYGVLTVGDDKTHTDHPANIGDSYVVYVGGNSPNTVPTVIGYRDGDTWYDAAGREVQDPQVLKTGTNSQSLQPYLQSTPKLPSEGVPDIKKPNFKPDESFTDYKPQVNVMPRINFSFPLSEEALFYAHYDVLYQRPGNTAAYETQTGYTFLDQNPSEIYGNSNLKPERAIDYEIGFVQQLSQRSGITVSGFYKERKDQIQIRPYLYAYPITYYTYGNRDYSTYKGLSLAYELRRLGNLTLNINYTLSFAEGTGSDARSANGGSGTTVSGNSLLSQLVASGLPNLRTQFPLTFDSRHNINVQADYRFIGIREEDPRGPMIAGGHPFQNAGIQLIFTARSGEPYTKYATAQNLQSGSSNSKLIEGTVNGSRLPGHYNVDINIDKTIPLKSHKAKDAVAARPSRLGLNIYAYARNIFNIKDIRQVYGYTGRVDDDGYLSSPLAISQAGTLTDQQSFNTLYNLNSLNPDFVGAPRTILVGLRLNF